MLARVIFHEAKGGATMKVMTSPIPKVEALGILEKMMNIGTEH